VGGEPIQGPPQAIVVQSLRGNPRTDQTLDRFVCKELGHQGEAAIAQPQTIQNRGQHRLAQRHTRMRLLIKPIEILYQAHFLTNPRDDPQVIEPLHRKMRQESLLRRAVVRVSPAGWNRSNRFFP
jgi:hypothetical protein